MILFALCTTLKQVGKFRDEGIQPGDAVGPIGRFLVEGSIGLKIVTKAEDELDSRKGETESEEAVSAVKDSLHCFSLW